VSWASGRNALGQRIEALLPTAGHDDVDALLGVAFGQRLAQAARRAEDGDALLSSVSEASARESYSGARLDGRSGEVVHVA